MLTTKWRFVAIFTLLSVSWAMAAPPAVNPTTGAPLVMTCYRGTPDAIDGDLSDWNLDAMTPAVLDSAAQIYTGQSFWTGPADLSGKFYVMWDDKNVYFAVIVKDDVIVTDKTGVDIWNADCVEIFFGTTNWGTSPTDHTQHYQWGFNASNQTWNWENLDGGAGVVPTNLKVASKRVPGGYVCEAALDYTGIHAIKIAAGSTIGFHCCLDSTDTVDREIQMTWTGREAHDQSLGFGNLIFSPDPALPKGVSRNPNPGNNATDVPVDVVLSWGAGKFAASHDVYLGTSLSDVNNASRAKQAGVLVSQGQVGTTFAPSKALAYGQTYYWRIDEVNKAPDNTIYKGGVWSFTTETYGSPIPGTSITATASSAQPGMGPENTINGAGLDNNDQHGIDGSTMWLSTGTQPNWIQYQFDKSYKLYDLKVWNSNQMIEGFLGFGAKDVKIEYSTDGTTWTALAGVPSFARAPGMPGYAANTTVLFGGVMAKYVKLTVNSNWGGMSTVTGLSEVRFSYVPVQARLPQPATGATGQSLTTTLSWRPGREATSHKMFFGTDQAAVTNGTAPAKTLTAHAFDPGALAYGTTYYWRVDEVNTTTYPGDVWSFTTQEFAVVDDFESYNDDNNRIYDTWIDGLTDGKSGSTVGYLAAPFAEQTIVHGGVQSMPLGYNNVKTPYFSEATRTFAPVQDWTGGGADTLVLYVQGRVPGFVAGAGGTYAMGSSGTDIWNTADQFRFAFQSLTGNGTIVAKVLDVTNSAADVWGKAGVMIRESLAVGSKFAAVYATPGSGVRYQARLTADVAAVSDTAVVTAAQTALTAPVWVKVERIGSTFNGYYSTDGAKWTAMSWNPQTISMTAATVYIGLAVTGHGATETTTADFSNVATTGNVTGSWQAQSIGLAQPSNDPGQLYVTVQDSTGKSKLVNYPDLTATTTGTWQAWRIPLSQFTAAGVKMTSVKQLVIGVGNRTSPTAGGAGTVFIDDIGVGHPAK